MLRYSLSYAAFSVIASVNPTQYASSFYHPTEKNTLYERGMAGLTRLGLSQHSFDFRLTWSALRDNFETGKNPYLAALDGDETPIW
jgi:hypothetical protein